MKKRKSSKKGQAKVPDHIDDRSDLFKEIVAPGGELSPIHPHQLLTVGNPPASRSVPKDILTTMVSRHVIKQNSVPSDVKLKKSDIYPGMWVLPEGVSLVPGLPVKTYRVIRTKRGQPGKKKRPRGKGGNKVDANIPDWLPLGFHPIPAFNRTPRKAKTRDGRRIRLDDSWMHIFGDDNRINITPDTFPEIAVCRIEIFQEFPLVGWVFQKYGTGFMVGRRIMMTSGHLRPTLPGFPYRIDVIPGYVNGISAFPGNPGLFTNVRNVIAYGSDTGNDLMVCRLYDAIGDFTSWFGAIDYNDDWEDRDVWSMCGYPHDRGFSVPTLQGAISVIDDDDGDDIELPNGNNEDTTQIETYADGASGASGSPLYSWFKNGQLYAIGVYYGMEHCDLGGGPHSVHSGGGGFVELIKWARAEWP